MLIKIIKEKFNKLIYNIKNIQSHSIIILIIFLIIIFSVLTNIINNIIQSTSIKNIEIPITNNNDDNNINLRKQVIQPTPTIRIIDPEEIDDFLGSLPFISEQMNVYYDKANNTLIVSSKFMDRDNLEYTYQNWVRRFTKAKIPENLEIKYESSEDFYKYRMPTKEE